MKKFLSFILAAAMVLSCAQPVSVFADTTDSTYYVATDDSSDEGNLTYATGVTTEMCSASYWEQYSVLGADRVLADSDDIAAYNKAAYDGSGTGIGGIEKKAETFTAKNRIDSIPTTTYYCDGTELDNDTYFGNLITQYNATCYETGSTQNTGFGLCVKRTTLRSWPTADTLGYSANDTDDEITLSCLIVNEPVVVQQKCTIDGDDYYWVFTDNCSGWVSAADIAICDSKDQWLEAWHFDIDGDDFLVVTQDKLILETSTSNTYSSDVRLDMGTALRLVPESEWDDQIKELAERGTWNNYVVYLPVRTEDGGYEEKPALIAQHYSVSIGYLPLTETNVLKLAFSNLGDRYGWGGSLNALDCSAYTRNIYRCFGYTLPRNTTGQPKVTAYTTDLSSMSDQEKTAFLATLPIGSLLYFKGHAMVYIGTKDGVPYVISDTGSLSDSDGDLNVLKMNSVILNPLTVRRANGKTWLSELSSAVTFTSLRHTEHEYSDWTVTTQPTCTTAGEETRTCSICGASETQTVNAAGHTWDKGTTLIAASVYSKGIIKYTCVTCGAEKTEMTAQLKPAAISKLTLSKTRMYYTGYARYPSVTVTSGSKTIASNIVEGNANVSVTMSLHNKKPGTYKVTAKGIGAYTGTLSKTYQIVVKPTTIKSLSAVRKGFKITWAKQNSSYISGYQIQYSTNSSFKSAKTLTISRTGTTAKTRRSLSAKKKYYVRIRTYKTISGKKYYSAWSSVKTLKTK